MKQLPAENKAFKGVDSVWRDVIKQTKENPNILIRCEIPELKEQFEKANEDLELVQKGLKEYLEKKRASFARFYFLSDSDLLEILS